MEAKRIKLEEIQGIDSWYGNPKLTDCTIYSGTIKVEVHRFALCHIPYFRRMFQCGVQEALTEESHLTETVPPEHLNNFMEYVYCGTLQLTNDNVLAFLHISQQLLLEDMGNAVCDYVENALGDQKFQSFSSI